MHLPFEYIITWSPAFSIISQYIRYMGIANLQKVRSILRKFYSPTYAAHKNVNRLLVSIIFPGSCLLYGSERKYHGSRNILLAKQTRILEQLRVTQHLLGLLLGRTILWKTSCHLTPGFHR